MKTFLKLLSIVMLGFFSICNLKSARNQNASETSVSFVTEANAYVQPPKYSDKTEETWTATSTYKVGNLTCTSSTPWHAIFCEGTGPIDCSESETPTGDTTTNCHV